MNVKIQGGGSGRYANTGSCSNVVDYLQHEDLDRMKEGNEIEPFFNEKQNQINAKDVVSNIDNNKAKLCNSDSKFFVITASPSKEEIRVMGRTQQEQAIAFKDFVRSEVMQKYAEGFEKGLKSKDIEYYGKIHFERKGKEGEQMHAHIIVSRKDRSNTKKLSPQTNHRKSGKGAVKSGFDRTVFFRKTEKSFDKKFNYQRDPRKTFDYQNAIKNGNPNQIPEYVSSVIKNGEKIEIKREEIKQQQFKRGIGI
jgi:hypothetical protein